LLGRVNTTRLSLALAAWERGAVGAWRFALGAIVKQTNLLIGLLRRRS
jgi:hypothetical protein